MASEQGPPRRGLAVPSGRVSRLARIAGLASGVAGGMLVDGARQFAQGRRPSVGDLLLTPANALKVTRQLAHLRGASMKVGQLLSMDTGDLLPPELSDILAALRSDATPMPQAQLRAALNLQWGRGWEGRFKSFDQTPIAAASIGQVHRAITQDGRDLAIKIQYPGVRRSIDSDVDNVAALLSLSRVLPDSLEIRPMLAEAKRQLHEEADYVREGRCLLQFGELLIASPEFRVPGLHADFSTADVLAMDYVESQPIETLILAPQDARDAVMTRLIGLALRELFEFGLMQTDPNFANYRHDPVTGQVVLLDFGATRTVPSEVADRYRLLLRAGLAGDGQTARQAILDLGLLGEHTPTEHQHTVMAMLDMAMAALRIDAPFDFGDDTVVPALREEGMALAARREVWHVPPIDTLFLQRKFAGLYLLAGRLKARVDVRGLIEPWL